MGGNGGGLLLVGFLTRTGDSRVLRMGHPKAGQRYHEYHRRGAGQEFTILKSVPETSHFELVERAARHVCGGQGSRTVSI